MAAERAHAVLVEQPAGEVVAGPVFSTVFGSTFKVPPSPSGTGGAVITVVSMKQNVPGRRVGGCALNGRSGPSWIGRVVSSLRNNPGW